MKFFIRFYMDILAEIIDQNGMDDIFKTLEEKQSANE